MGGHFEGKVALVVGGSSGMGRSTAIAFAKEGAKVAIAARRKAEGEETADEIRKAGGEATFIQADVLRAAEVEAMVRKTVEDYSRLDYAFNTAGVETRGYDEENWDRFLNINLKGKWLCMIHEIPEMMKQGGGAIVNTSSANGLPGGIDGSSPIAVAANHGIVGLTKAMALRHAKDGIRINTVCPGLIQTPLAERAIKRYAEEHPGVDIKAKLIEMTPLGRIGMPEEIAEAVLWLCSDAAAFVTGCAFSVDGGMAAK